MASFLCAQNDVGVCESLARNAGHCPEKMVEDPVAPAVAAFWEQDASTISFDSVNASIYPLTVKTTEVCNSRHHRNAATRAGLGGCSKVCSSFNRTSARGTEYDVIIMAISAPVEQAPALC